MPTVSAYTSAELKEKIERIAREEGRRQAQVGDTALELYASLPAAARRAYLEMRAADEEDAAEALGHAVETLSLALLNARWEVTSARIVRETRAHGLLPDGDLSEEEIAAIAVDVTRDGGRGG